MEDDLSIKPMIPSVAGDSDHEFAVAVVTRTKDRGIFLRRAASSVASQSFDDFCWVVVNDGGNADEVEAIVRDTKLPDHRIRIVHNETSLGMEAASNIGIRQVHSEFVTIHDDDDSWDPTFLSKTIAFLRCQRGNKYHGVITHSTYVSEVVRGNAIVCLSEKPYQNRIENIDLEALIDRNLFPPISFVFRRSIWQSIGGFDESLPVLGDWLFNLEFLLSGDIGVIKEALAYYHHRDTNEDLEKAYRNTVVDQVALHRQHTTLVRNRFLRKNLNLSVVSLRVALQANLAEAPLAQEASRRINVAPPSYAQLRQPDTDLTWSIASVNAVLAERRFSLLAKYRKLSPLPPNAPWSLVLPMVRKLDCDIPCPPSFDEAGYLRANPDVAAEVEAKRQKSGYVHYLMHGRHEGRARSGQLVDQQHQVEALQSESQQPSSVQPLFNSLQMTRLCHTAAGFEKVLHIAHHEWHGIRQATAYNPGHKLLISAHETLSENEKKAIANQIAQLSIQRVCFQGYSDNADLLLLYLRAVLGPGVKFFVVSHVTTAQFDNHFEMVVIARLLNRLRFGVLDGIGSVKPKFAQSVEGFWPKTVINYAPNLPLVRGQRSSKVEIYAPLDVGWRKNLFTNIIAGSIASNVDVVKTANFPNGLESVHDLSKLRLVGYLRGRDLYDEMARSSLTLIATLAECQPMTQLESFAVGTPAITGPLEVEEFFKDPLVQLCTTSRLDNPGLLARDIEKVIDALKSDESAMYDMITDHLSRRHTAASQNYAEFLEL
ncbi:glycosyltransferase family A protein [Erythrobacter sp. T5W1-R]|uniref:glycosyltransferase family 2 protein n=1 Tax=Erythrobacter sp. T5W1-R TaxID=3101752 RepID=UPI002AFE4C69|nr:glycosyltransferase family A protein [Erythrobacter sp. T5W1-R]MEA1619900.1 glycosyltransferase family A protein [Erythrobacter sp. T5W1-R]